MTPADIMFATVVAALLVYLVWALVAPENLQ
jgi:hypothetical protein